jgi:hypothetical protein
MTTGLIGSDPRPPCAHADAKARTYAMQDRELWKGIVSVVGWRAPEESVEAPTPVLEGVALHAV